MSWRDCATEESGASRCHCCVAAECHQDFTTEALEMFIDVLLSRLVRIWVCPKIEDTQNANSTKEYDDKPKNFVGRFLRMSIQTQPGCGQLLYGVCCSDPVPCFWKVVRRDSTQCISMYSTFI